MEHHEKVNRRDTVLPSRKVEPQGYLALALKAAKKANSRSWTAVHCPKREASQKQCSDTAAHKSIKSLLQMEAAHSQLSVYRSTASAPGQRIIAVFNGAKFVRVGRRERLRTGTMMWGIEKEESKDSRLSQPKWPTVISHSNKTTCQISSDYQELLQVPSTHASLNPKHTMEWCGCAWAGKPGQYTTSYVFHCCKTGNLKVTWPPKYNIENKGEVCLHRCWSSLESETPKSRTRLHYPW